MTLWAVRMADGMPLPDLLSKLQNVLASGMLPEAACQNGERLLQRLSSPIHVTLLGPDGPFKEKLLQLLRVLPIADTQISQAGQGGASPFEHSDICLWCTTDCSAAEMDIWCRAPDRLKDHSFLVPMADQETMTVRFAADRLDAMQDLADEEFHSMYPVILGPLETEATSSTLGALVAEISNLVSAGRAADQDNAAYFLQTHQMELIESMSAAPKDVAEDTSPATSSGDGLPRAAAPESSSSAPVEIYQQAYDHICERASEISPPNSEEDSAGIERLLSICQEAAETVAEIFSGTDSNDPDFQLLKEDVLCSADKLLLMSMERGVAPAIAAVTTLLQTRREMQARFAA